MSGQPRAKYFRDPPLKVFGERIRALRTARGWSQMELSHHADRHFTFVSSIERGKRNVTLLTILQLAEALGVDAGVLVSNDASQMEIAIASPPPPHEPRRRR